MANRDQKVEPLHGRNDEVNILRYKAKKVAFCCGRQEKSIRLISVSDIICQCEAPVYKHCQWPCGLLTCVGGVGLNCCCYYGCNKEDCMSVAIGGVLLEITTPFIYGCVAACCVGAKMIRCCESISEEQRAERLDQLEFKRQAREARMDKVRGMFKRGGK